MCQRPWTATVASTVKKEIPISSLKIGRTNPTSPRAIILGMPFRDWLKQALTDDLSILPLTPDVCTEANELRETSTLTRWMV